MSKITFSFLIVLFFISFVSSVSVDEGVYEGVKKGEINVIIKVDPNPGFVDKILGVDPLKKVKEDLGGNLRREFEDVITAEVDSEDIAELEKNGRVEKIFIVPERHLFLQDSVPLINGTRTLSLKVGEINLTGTGETICIIDSGIDYTHSDLGGCYGENDASSGCKVIGGHDFVGNDGDPKDDNGHGTHVGGIVGGNGGRIGVAPNAKIVSIKACNVFGSCSDDDVKSGIEWCIGNKSKFNISVISMSLGSGLYSGACDYIDDPLNITKSINDAVQKDISVVVAAGNGLNNIGAGRAKMIASPACISNATAVSATDKSDIIGSYADRSSEVLLMAPGSSIISTHLGGGYIIRTGTSMAAPHLAGAIALLNQYLDLIGESKTPSEIEDILNVTGKVIVDSHADNEANYSRINIYEAVIYLDMIFPNVSLDIPDNDSKTIDTDIIFSCSADDLSLKNGTLYLWNSTGLVNSTLGNISGNSIIVNISNLTKEDYEWNCEFYDEKSNGAYALANSSFSIKGLLVELISPIDKSGTNKNESFICNTNSTTELINVSFFFWNSTGLHLEVRNISGIYNETTFYHNFTDQGEYNWTCLAGNNLNEFATASNYSVTYDVVKPEVELNSPYDGFTATGENDISFIYNVSGEASSCSLILNQDNKANSSNLSEITFTIVPGTYIWMINCTDLAGNVGNSSIKGLVANAIPPIVTSSSSGGGGGGGGGGSGRVNVIYVYEDKNESEEDKVEEKIPLFEEPLSSPEEVNLDEEPESFLSITGSVIGDALKRPVIPIILLIVIFILIGVVVRAKMEG